MPPERRFQIETALLATALPANLALYSGVHHGFALAVNTSDPQAKFAKDAAFAQAARWFDAWL
jgi:dienelactone hydrolase